MGKNVIKPVWSKHVSRGKPARLFSALKLSNKEQIATSTLLAVFRLVPELLSELIKDVGLKITDKSTFHALTEVNLVKENPSKKDRPDGYLYLKNRNEWSALVEAKVGKNSLNPEQVSRYLEDARSNNIDALITISNEFSPRVDQSPVDVPKRLLNRVKLYHFSWRLILSKAQLLKQTSNIEDREKSFVLEELIRFLRDDSVGDKNFSLMPASWVDVSKEITVGAKLKASDQRLSDNANALVEEFSEIALNLTDHLGVNCSAKLPASYINDKNLWQKSIVRSMIEGKPVSCQYSIPDAANSMFVEIDIAKSTIAVGMEIEAPKDKKTISGKVNWIMRQLKNHDVPDSYIKVRWNSRAADTFAKMNEILADLPIPPSKTTNISTFTPMIQLQSTRTLQSRKSFIVELEQAVLTFYDEHAQYLRSWTPRAPIPIEEHETDE